MGKVIVTGGRNYKNKQFLFEKLDELNANFIIEGGANGADALAREYVTEKRLQGKTYYADWDTYGRSAGPIRNKEMLESNKDAIVVVFPGGAGTRNCHNLAIKLGMKVVDFSS